MSAALATRFPADLLDGLVARVARLAATCGHARVVIGIAGAPGAGKTTLAEDLVAHLATTGPGPVAHVPMDGFHLADAALDRLGRRARKGAPDTFDAGGYAALLRRIRAGETVWAPAFERTLEQPIAGSIAVDPDVRVVVTEGNYLLLPDPGWEAARAACDEVWFLRVDPALRRRRLRARHERFGKPAAAARDWVATVDEPNAVTVEAAAARADHVITV